MSSPTSRSLELLRAEGWIPWVVERWIPGANKRVDLFNFGDILAIRDGAVMIIQTTTASNVSSRIHKIKTSPFLPIVQKAKMFIEVHGWAKRKGRWACVRREDLS